MFTLGVDIALFADYDGTLALPEKAREERPLPPSLEEALRKLAALMPFAVVTTKDCQFVMKRVPFASAYACINGIEIHAAGYVAVAADVKYDAVESLYRKATGLNALVEPKRTWRGDIAGFTIDWRDSGIPPPGLEELVREASGLGIRVVKYSRHPFLDFYGSNVDKGNAVRILKALLGVKHVVYMGDSENDIPAWREADIKILVRHSLNRGLSIEGVIPIDYEHLPAYLQEVAKNVTDIKG